jgi:hypothetical protein
MTGAVRSTSLALVHQERDQGSPDTFAQEASSFNLLAIVTLTPKQSLLSEGQKFLLFQSPSSRDDLLERTYRSYCQSRY